MRIIEQAQWTREPGRWRGEIEGAAHGADISIIFNSRDEPGGGPRLHKHPYPETFIMRIGRALFTVGDREIVAEAGQIIIVPADTAHKFTNLGPGPLESINIHASENFVTEWLE